MKVKEYLQSDFLLLLAAAIWGFAFVAQSIGARYLGPFLFNGIRFAMGGLLLLPLLRFSKSYSVEDTCSTTKKTKIIWLIGSVLFIAAALQQVGMKYTTAGNAGFITGLYVLFVPFIGIAQGKMVTKSAWTGVFLSIIGLFLITVPQSMSVNIGDMYVLASAFFFAFHVVLIGIWSRKINPIELSIKQFLICSMYSLLFSFLFEKNTLSAIYTAAIPLIYGGAFSVAIAYTLQVIAQRKAEPTHSAICLSMESMFALLAGWTILSEKVTIRTLLGCTLIFSAMLISQLHLMDARSRRIAK